MCITERISRNSFIVILVYMEKYSVPLGMRAATLAERKQFYMNEFDIEKIISWFRDRAGKTKFAVIIGRHTDVFPIEYEKDKNTTIIIDEYENFNDLRSHILAFLPESVYYDRNVYDVQGNVLGQELAFDIDPENVICPVHGSIADKMKRHQGLSFCTIELDMVKDQTVRLYEYLEKQFSKLQIVYSGRGFHIHVFDKEAYLLSIKQRTEIAERTKAEGFAIDTWVTSGEMRLIRLPYSLHGMVSRLVLPLDKNEVKQFNPITDTRCLPLFLKNNTATSF